MYIGKISVYDTILIETQKRESTRIKEIFKISPISW